ncbi:hypothetical protein HRED_00321 [Candidatus Haloredivivus sp. G17]|jgi:hypothetical protein|nr:hypothetical protein HRED_00321 [Candidatus Haloredivivus sp. G17]
MDSTPPQSYGLNHMDSVKEAVNTQLRPVKGRERFETVKAIRQDYQEFSDQLGLEGEEAARNFMASAGMIASQLEYETDRDTLFEAVRDALSPRSRTKLVADFLSPVKGGLATWTYEGLEETELRKAYDNMETGV